MKLTLVAPSKAIVFLMSTVMLDILALSLIVPVMPLLLQQITGLSPQPAARLGGELFALFALMQLFAAPILGTLSDHFGRRPILLISLCAYALDWFVMGWAQTLFLLFLGRAISGVVGATGSTVNAAIADTYSAEKRAKYLGMVSSVMGIAMMCGAALGGWLAMFGSRVPFYFAAGFAFVNFVYGLVSFRETLPRAQRRPLEWARIHPLRTIALLRAHPQLAKLLLAFFLWQLAFMVFPSTWAYYCAARLGWDPRMIGLSFSFTGLCAALVQVCYLGKMIARWGERLTVLIGCIVAILALFAYGTLTQVWMIFVVLGVGASCYVAGPTLNALLCRCMPPDEQGYLQGIIASSTSLAIIIGQLMMTQVFASTSKWIPGLTFYLSALLVLGTLLCTFSTSSPEATPYERGLVCES